MEPVYLLDTTLRDGMQGENINFTPEEKIRIAKKLDDLGVHYIEGGWPGSNLSVMTFFELAKDVTFQNAKLTAFSSTRRPGRTVEEDKHLNALIECQAPVVTIFGKTWDLHIEKIMNNTLKENLSMIRDSVSYLKNNGREVIYDAEHFFDGYKGNREYAIKTLFSALDGGADFVTLCDTNGGTLPHEIKAIIEDVKKTVENTKMESGDTYTIRMGIHAHNDCGVAVANSISSVQAGAVMIHGTINGYGERCGNADLTSIIPILCLKMSIPCLSMENLKKLKNVSRFVSETANMTPLKSRPFVGKSAFAHKGGIHVSAVKKIPMTYEHMDPELVGNNRRVLVSEQAGKSNIEFKAKELGIDLDLDGTDTQKIISEIKRLEQEGYQYEVADGSFKILVEKLMGRFKPHFELRSFMVTVIKEKDRPCTAQASLKIAVGDDERITVAEGDGPVSALDNALRKALNKFYPGALDSTHLVDFKVRVIDGRDGTKAKVRLIIESRDEKHIWGTIGISDDIIEASWEALTDCFQYKLDNIEKEKTLK
ncbi:MAG: citramalate synthase [Proteobacteria bacterium]|nr:citramalate synthase [Pseudomonadota bacterium]